ncbi:hypothetical protein SERLA73DRAFT_165499 [Serpula lacrymans var. lacrymans S7.3]|uniref:Uncharacterized protein n=1 Tax=Serpula lacrymans var. lacrymans (strain S7.3) TaxID=936435 RepID=F8PL46_SERL3|nr:hypothetical protein SERLA73DRAFT_165499 [Serpula lacrymans var. lacrymans S7.3]
MPVEAGEDLKTLTQSELATAYRHWRDVTPLEMREFYDAIQAAPADTFIHLQGSVQARDVDDDATDDGEDDAVEQYYIAMLERRAKRVQELKENEMPFEN